MTVQDPWTMLQEARASAPEADPWAMLQEARGKKQEPLGFSDLEFGWDRAPLGIGTGVQFAEAARVIDAIEAQQGGTITPEQDEFLREFSLKTERDKTFWYKVGDIALDVPGFLVDIAAGFGLAGRAASAIGKKGIKEILEGYLVNEAGKRVRRTGVKEAAKRVAVGATAGVAGMEAVQAVGSTIATGQPGTASMARTQQLRIPGMATVPGEGDEVEVLISGTVDGFLETLPEGLLDTAIEIASEMSGGLIGAGLAKTPLQEGIKRIQRKVFGRLAEKLGSTSKALEAITKGGWNGPVNEWLEEWVGHGARTATGLPTEAPGLAEFVAFSILGAGMTAGGAALGLGDSEAAGAVETPTPAQEADQEAAAPAPAPAEPSGRAQALLEATGAAKRAQSAFPSAVPVDALSERERGLVEEFAAEGVDLVLFQGSETARTRPAAELGGEVVGMAREALESPEWARRLRWHEPVHTLKRRHPEEFKAFADAIEAISPARARFSEQEYSDVFGAGERQRVAGAVGPFQPGREPRERTLSPELLAEEGVAYRVEGLWDWLDRAATPEGLAELEKAAAVPSVWKRIVTAIRRMLGLEVENREDAMTALEAHRALRKLRGPVPPSRQAVVGPTTEPPQVEPVVGPTRPRFQPEPDFQDPLLSGTQPAPQPTKIPGNSRAAQESPDLDIPDGMTPAQRRRLQRQTNRLQRRAREARAAGRQAEAQEIEARTPKPFRERSGRRAGETREETAERLGDEPGFEGVRFAAAPPPESEAFRKWFGKSRVVDARGAPLVVYHGAPDIRELNEFTTPMERLQRYGYGNAEYQDPERAFFFTDSRAIASTYADDRRAFDYQGAEPGVLSVYLRLENPAEIDMRGATWHGTGKAVEQARAEGRDGIIIRNVLDPYTTLEGPKRRHKPSTNYVVFDPRQIKSATGNRGTFDPTDPDIRHAAALPPTDYELPPERLVDKLGRTIIDRYVRITQQEKRITGKAGDVTSAIRRFPGKAGARVQDVQKREVEPFYKLIAREKLDAEELSLYVYARTAPEVNALHQQRGMDAQAEVERQRADDKKRVAALLAAGLTAAPRTFKDARQFDPEEAGDLPTGSGMKTSEANARVARVNALPNGPAYQQAFDMLRSIAEKGLTERVEDGLLKPETAAAYRKTRPNYLPLRTERGDGVSFRRGQGFTVSGEEYKRAMGRGSMADSPVVFTILQRMEGIIRGEKDKGGLPFLEMLEANPDPTLWTVDHKPSKTPLLDEAGVPMLGPRAPIPENVWTIKRAGEQYDVTFKDPLLARAIKNLGVEGTPTFLRYVSKVTRFVAAVNTSWSPEFLIGNFSRDIQEALVHAAGENGASVARTILRRVVPSIRAIWDVEANPDAPGVAQDSYREMKAHGGAIAFYGSHSFESIDETAQRAVEQFQQKPSDPRRAFRSLMDTIERVNRAVENGTRHAFYWALRDAGIAPEPAALAARDLTVDFQRKGEWSHSLGAMWMFFNAGAQGSWRVMRATARSPKVRAIVGGIAVSAAVLELVNLAAGGDDDEGVPWWDQIPEHVKRRNWILMLPGGEGKHIKLPMPYGYNVAHNLGRNTMEAIRGAKTPWAAAGDVVAAGFDSFNPLGSAPTLLQFLAPTIMDPVVQTGENMAWYGGPLMPEQNPFEAPRPDSQLYFQSISPAAKAAAQTLNSLTGGDEIEPGTLDVSPETLELWYDFLTGDIGRTGRRISNLLRQPWREEPVEANEIPLFRRVFGEADPRFAQSTFYDNLRELELVERRVKLLRESRDTDGLRAFLAENRRLVALAGRADAFRSRVKKLRDRERTEDAERQMRRFNRQMDDAKEAAR